MKDSPYATYAKKQIGFNCVEVSLPPYGTPDKPLKGDGLVAIWDTSFSEENYLSFYTDDISELINFLNECMALARIRQKEFFDAIKQASNSANREVVK